MRNLIITFVLMLGFAVSAHAQTYTLDFMNDNPYGANGNERAVADGTILLFDSTNPNGGIYVEFSATGSSDSDNDGYAYFDSGNAGLGVCTSPNDINLCVPNYDDNLTLNETVTLTFWSSVVLGDNNDLVGETLASVGIYGLVFRDGNHDIITDGSTLTFGMDGGGLTSTSMTGFGWNGMANSFSFGYDGTPYYISSILVSEVPEPATWLMMIIGFGIVSAATRRSRRSTSIAHTC